MITNNFRKYIYARLCKGGSYDNPRYGKNVQLKSTTGEEVYISSSQTLSDWPCIFNNLTELQQYGQRGNEAVALLLGSNGVETTQDDYEWSHDIGTLVSNSMSYQSINIKGKDVIRITRTVTNNTESDIVVKEVGLVGTIGSRQVLLAREVIDSGIVIKSGGYRRSVSTLDRYDTKCAA